MPRPFVAAPLLSRCRTSLLIVRVKRFEVRTAQRAILDSTLLCSRAAHFTGVKNNQPTAVLFFSSASPAVHGIAGTVGGDTLLLGRLYTAANALLVRQVRALEPQIKPEPNRNHDHSIAISYLNTARSPYIIKGRVSRSSSWLDG